MDNSSTGTYTVQLNLYDLSNGMAKKFSPMFLGKEIEAIWHTGLVIYGKEYFFGGGICEGSIADTPYGTPIRTLEYGRTNKTRKQFFDFLREISPKYEPEKYDLFKNNCNNFTDDCLKFLLGKGLPDHIIGLPDEFLKTPLGKLLEPGLNQMQQKMTQQSTSMFGDEEPIKLDPNSPLKIIDSVEMVHKYLEENSAVIVAFLSLRGPTCVTMTTLLEKYAKDYAESCPELKFTRVVVDYSKEVTKKYGISIIPAFLGFYQGQRVERFTGANETKLAQLVSLLEKKVIENRQKDVKPLISSYSIQEKPLQMSSQSASFLSLSQKSKRSLRRAVLWLS